MHRHGGPGSWFFVPYIFCMTQIPKQILNRLEQQEIKLYPMHLNKEQRHRRKIMVKRAQYSSLHSARGSTLPQSGVWNSRPIHTARLTLYYGNGTVLSSGVDPTLAIETAENILIHSSLLILSPRTHIQRTLGQSVVQCYMVGQGVDLVWIQHNTPWPNHCDGPSNSHLAGCVLPSLSEYTKPYSDHWSMQTSCTSLATRCLPIT